MAISADPVGESLELADKREIPFPLLSDPQLRVIVAFGVKEVGAEIAVPSVFLVDQKGMVLWRHVGESISNRPSPKKLLEIIRQAGYSKHK